MITKIRIFNRMVQCYAHGIILNGKENSMRIFFKLSAYSIRKNGPAAKLGALRSGDELLQVLKQRFELQIYL